MNWTGAVRCTAAGLLALLVAACGTGNGNSALDSGDPSAATILDATSTPAAASTATSKAKSAETPTSASAATTTATATELSTTTENNASSATTVSPPPCTPTSGPESTLASTPTSVRPSTSSAPTTSASSTTTEPTTTSTLESNPELAARQAILDQLGYWLGDIDGAMGSMTSHAVTAFQKAEGLGRTGEFDTATIERLPLAGRPQARTGSGDVLEVDLQRQILLVVSDGAVSWVFDIATGAAATPTPVGEFVTYNEIDGFRHAPLGTLYRPKYFNGGIALHGFTSVPPEPASHGCVRLTYPAMDFVWEAGLAPLGSTVVVY